MSRSFAVSPADVVYVSRVLGHSSPSITLDVYADLFDRARHEERATTALDRAFGGGLCRRGTRRSCP